MRPELFVFDMIGTTIEPSDAIPEAFRSALCSAGLQLSDDEITAVRGKSKREATAELQAGVNAGVRWNFGVLTGAHDRGRLSAVDGAIILGSVAELPEYHW